MGGPLNWLATIAVLGLFFLGCAEAAPVEGALCSEPRPCPKSYGCIGGRCRAVPPELSVRCTDDERCSVGVCLKEAGFCVQCTEDHHCPGSACLETSLVCGCEDRSDCATGRCQPELMLCLSCFADEHCPEGRCDLDTGRCEFLDEALKGGERRDTGLGEATP